MESSQATPDAHPMIGTIVDRRFEIVAKLAVGGFAAVYRAVDLETNTQIALKVLRADLATDASLAARFRREGEILSRLRDEHTVRVLASGRAPDGTMYLALELLRGEGLDERLHDEGRLPWQRALELVREACSSLAEVHALGIVHRDLKPANLFLARDSDLVERVTVIDFGVAKQTEAHTDDAEVTRIGQAVGTIDYMAPEQLVGNACDARTDIYTLGVVAYELITGRRPFADAQGPTALFTALLTQTAEPVSSIVDVPLDVERLIARCLERDPDDRFWTVHELARAIDDALAPAFDDITQVTAFAEGTLDGASAPKRAPSPLALIPTHARGTLAPRSPACKRRLAIATAALALSGIVAGVISIL